MEDSSLIALDLSETSEETIMLFMEETADDSIFDEIFDTNQARSSVIKLLYEHPRTPDETRARAAGYLSLPVPSASDVENLKKRAAEELESQPVDKRIKKKATDVEKLGISAKIKMGMKAGSEMRKLLIRDSNKMVVMSVMGNPRMTESEVEMVAKNRSIVEDALRAVVNNREWMKNYTIKLALVNNPKTPMALAMKYVPGLKAKDLKQLEKNKNVSEGVRTMAKKVVKKGQGGK
jgi:hypothetical protein